MRHDSFLSMTADRCFDNGYVGKQLVALRECCAESWLNEPRESMGRCAGRRELTEILLKTVLNTIQSINQSFVRTALDSLEFFVAAGKKVFYHIRPLVSNVI